MTGLVELVARAFRKSPTIKHTVKVLSVVESAYDRGQHAYGYKRHVKVTIADGGNSPETIDIIEVQGPTVPLFYARGTEYYFSRSDVMELQDCVQHGFEAKVAAKRYDSVMVHELLHRYRALHPSKSI